MVSAMLLRITDCINTAQHQCMLLLIVNSVHDPSILGYEPADLTVHPPPRTAEGGFIFFV